MLQYKNKVKVWKITSRTTKYTQYTNYANYANYTNNVHTQYRKKFLIFITSRVKSYMQNSIFGSQQMMKIYIK